MQTTHDVETILDALLVYEWIELEMQGPRPEFRLDDRYSATIHGRNETLRTSEFHLHQTEEGARALATPVAQRLEADVAVKPMEHCGIV